MKKRGFTLIEMLIVIVIIGILAATLIPRIGNARDRAADVARMADVRSIATALISYRLDHGSLPRSLEDLIDEEVDYGLGGSVPTDPDDGTGYQYLQLDGGRHFIVCAHLSNGSMAGNSNENFCNGDGVIASIKNNGFLARFAPEVHAEEKATVKEEMKIDEGPEQCCKKDLKELEEVRDEYERNEAYTKGGLLIQCYKNDSFLKVLDNDNLYCPSNIDICEEVMKESKDGKGECYFDMSKYDGKLFEYYTEGWNNCTNSCIKDYCNGDQSCIENNCFNNGEKCKDNYKNYNNYLENPELDKQEWYKKYNKIAEELADVEKCIKYQKGGNCDGNGGSSLSYKEIVKKLGKNKGEYYIYAY